MAKSETVREAVDNMAAALVNELRAGAGGYEYQQIANQPIERVLAFNNDEYIALKGTPEGKDLHFSSHGTLTDLRHNPIPGSKVETTFPVDAAAFPATVEFPKPQKPPWDGPPLNEANTTGNGYSKQAYFFDNEASSLITVGPSLPKIARAKGGTAQFWVGSIGVITQGTGKYEGARGVSVYIGSAYLPKWPDKFEDQIKILQTGFKALVGTYFKFIFKADQA